MSVRTFYDEIAPGFATTQQAYDMYSKARTRAVEQIANMNKEAGDLSIIDLGGGDGAFLAQLSQRLRLNATIVDVSPGMLALAKKKLPVRTVEASIDEAHRYVERETFDVVSAHFVCAYTGLPTVLAQARKLLRENGRLSLITTTFESFAHGQDILRTRCMSTNPVERMISRALSRTGDKSRVPRDTSALLNTLHQHGFSKKTVAQLDFRYSFANSTEGWAFLRDGGWIGLRAWGPILDPFARWLSRRFLDSLSYPFEEFLRVDVVLAKKE